MMADPLADLFREALSRARAAWPTLRTSDAAFVAYLAERTPPGESPSSLCVEDLFLACACLEHDETALAIFETHYVKQVRSKVGQLRLSEANLDELEQQLRSELLVAEPGARPKLASYQGQGELAGWLRVTAVRAGLRLLPRKDTDADDEPLAEMPDLRQNPELAFLKSADQAAFREAFRTAMSSLPAKDQNLLRQHYIDGLSIDRLGELHQTHRTSAARWLRQARETLFRRTKSFLMKQTRASVSECESMIRQAQSQMEITFRSLLG